MADYAEYYVDPSIAADSGTGTSGDPFGDLQYALNNITRDTTNGDRINIKAGTSELLTAVISYATYGNPDANSPLIFQGYTSSAGDGGQGVVSCNGGAYAAFPSKAYVKFKDLRITNSTTTLITLSTGGLLEDCEIDTTTTSGGGISLAGVSTIRACNIHDIPGIVITTSASGVNILNNYIVHTGTGSNLRCIDSVMGNARITRNIIVCSGAAVGVYLRSATNLVEYNSILSSSGTGSGIETTAAGDELDIIGNLIEGFSGSGGCGIETAGNSRIRLYTNNAFYNNATHESIALLTDILQNLGDNESLGATPFAKSGSNTFANRFTYFAPADTGNVQNGGYPSGIRLDKGATQHADPAGGGGASQLINSGALVG